MRRQLPPLNALRAFEAAARHLSISRAAGELNVTPAAISHQIRLLEDHIGLPVFMRNGRGLSLTDAGAAGLRDLREGFARLSAAMDAIDSLGEAGVLSVSVAPSFAAKWLLPRLDSFQTRHPEIDVHVSASMQLVDFARDGVDIAIRYGAGGYSDLVVEKLLTEKVIPVCSPELLKSLEKLDSISDLVGVTLLHDDSPDNDPSCPNWEMWLRAAGITHIDTARGPRFNQSSMVIEAAVLGRGVALAKAALAAEDLKAGRLVQPFASVMAVDFAYYIVAPRGKLNLPKVSFFVDWLKQQAQNAELLRDVA
ncbi:MAG: transcriptional regulator GcvA [Alphaproteobacteria bacterium]|jgi:LysR family glycine cleavage system transcriptional activator|nr:transcriptional regulator GcvA [Alphaproteobacteria bacterium]